MTQKQVKVRMYNFITTQNGCSNAHAQKIRARGHAFSRRRRGPGKIQNNMAEKSNEELLPTQLPARPVRHDRMKENRGGYDCDFVVPPPEAFQTECPVCLLVLKEPCLISCCGHKFCQKCIEGVKKDDKPCPLCGEQEFTFMRERGLERFLKGLAVFCSYTKESCEWRGELGKLEEHLNRNSSLENQLNGCEFVAVKCMYYDCGEWFQRRHIAAHQSEQCKKRPYSCKYCQDYAATFDDVTEIHYPQCGKYPIACPNGCDVDKMERQCLEDHLKDKCPLTVVDCPFHYAGCETQLPRKDMNEHIKETVTHVTLLAAVTQRLSIENQKLTTVMQTLVKENQELRESATAVTASLQELNTKYDSVVAENQQLHKEKDKLTKKAIKKVSETSSGEIQHLRLQLQATIAQSQGQIEDYHQQCLRALQCSENKQVRCYIIHHNIEHNLQRINRLQNICVSASEITSTRESELRSMYLPVFPLDFYVKQSDELFFSPAFFTHPRGYRMCLRVNPKGEGNGKGTHVSIFTYMMRGPFDDYLKWPFRGKITIQMVNQAGDHVEKTIYFNYKTPDDSAGRVTDSERAGKGRGRYQFIAHADLGYTAARMTRCLKDDHLLVRVVKVILTD